MRSKHWDFPPVTALLALFVTLVMLLPAPVQETLYFDHHAIASGSLAGLLTGHWVHADVEHYLWNTLAFVVLAGIIERRSIGLLVLSLCIGIVCVDLLLFSPFNTVQRYCGLSGVLNTLLGVVLILYWRETQSRWVIAFGVACVGKILIELSSGDSIITNISWPPYALAHIAGMIGVPFAWSIYSRWNTEETRTFPSIVKVKPS